jgi:hypothetical protein
MKPKYVGLNKRALQHFKGCHNRVRDGKVKYIEWERTREGYIAFMKEIGPKPRSNQKWSVGRIDHTLGYQSGNIRWELFIYNSIKRKGTKHEHSRKAIVKLRPGPKFKIGTPEHIEHQRKISRRYWSIPAHRQKQSKRMKGNTNWQPKERAL